jgi:hypothetical protein
LRDLRISRGIEFAKIIQVQDVQAPFLVNGRAEPACGINLGGKNRQATGSNLQISVIKAGLV